MHKTKILALFIPILLSGCYINVNPANGAAPDAIPAAPTPTYVQPILPGQAQQPAIPAQPAYPYVKKHHHDHERIIIIPSIPATPAQNNPSRKILPGVPTPQQQPHKLLPAKPLNPGSDHTNNQTKLLLGAPTNS